MKRLVAVLVMAASLGVGAGTAHADTAPVLCVRPYILMSGRCVYWDSGNHQ